MIYFCLLGAIYFLNVLGRMLFPMILPQLAEEYLLSSSKLGALYLLLAFGFGLSLFGAQFLSAKISHKQAISLSAISGGCLLCLFPSISHFYALGAFLFCLGGASGLFLPSAIAYLRHLFHENLRGRVVGSFSSFQTLSMIVTPLIAGRIGGISSLRSLCLILGVSLILSGLIFEATAKNRTERGDLPSLDYFKEAITSPTNRWVFVLHVLAMGLNLGIYLTAPAYFSIDHIVPQDTIYATLSLSRVMGIFASILGGILIDFWGLRFALTAVLFSAGISTCCLGIFPPTYALFLLSFQGAIAIGFTTMIYAALAKISPKGRSASLVSLFASSSFFLGAGVIPHLFGLLGSWQLYSLGFTLLGLGSASISFFFFRHFRVRVGEFSVD
jgi:MFS family permease